MSQAEPVDSSLVLILAITVLVGLAGIFFFLSRASAAPQANVGQQRGRNEAGERNVAASTNGQRRENAPAAPAGRRTNAGRAASSRMGSSIAQTQHAEDVSDDDDENYTGNYGDEASGSQGKIGKKKLAKMQQKEQEKREKENQEAMKEAKKKDEEERRKRKEEERKDKDKKKEEEDDEAEKLRKEVEERERLEYEAFRAQFQVVDAGSQQIMDEQENQSLLNEFISHIKETKVVMLEDLAVKFKLPTTEVIRRLQELEKNGSISGVMDDRGKFIYITKSEMENICRFINLQGRVTISDLVEKSSELINLQTISA